MPLPSIVPEALEHHILVFAISDEPDIVGVRRELLGDEPLSRMDVAQLERALFLLHLPTNGKTRP